MSKIEIGDLIVCTTHGCKLIGLAIAKTKTRKFSRYSGKQNRVINEVIALLEDGSLANWYEPQVEVINADW